jgi:NAD(P)-dependent dehydrogenase (short-subunit alcohol dehydrogenase family)
MGELDGKVAVITGAGSGMARACSRVFVREGAQVLAADISGREEETAAVLGDAVKPFRVDVTQEAQVEAMFAAALEAFGRVDAVLNVAGIGGAEPVHKVTMAEYDRIMDVDLRGVLLGTKHAIRTMRETGGGSIVNVNTQVTRKPWMQQAAYATSKAALAMATVQMATEVGKWNIRVNSTFMGWMWGHSVEQAFDYMSKESGQSVAELKAAQEQNIALRRMPTDRECARPIIILLSDYCSVVTGASLDINGGEFMPG